MLKESHNQDPLHASAKRGFLDEEIGRVVCMTRANRVQEGIDDMFDDQGGPNWPGRWKKRRST